MTWSPFFTLVTPGPTSTTMPAPSWPRMAGNSPSGSAPDSVNWSVWQMPVALMSTRTSPARGPSSLTVVTSSGLPGPKATAARTSIVSPCIRGRDAIACVIAAPFYAMAPGYADGKCEALITRFRAGRKISTIRVHPARQFCITRHDTERSHGSGDLHLVRHPVVFSALGDLWQLLHREHRAGRRGHALRQVLAHRRAGLELEMADHRYARRPGQPAG